MTYTGTCKQCGNEFTSSRSHAEFCSGKCRAAYSREAKKPKAHEAHESAQPNQQAEIDGFKTFQAGDSHEYITIPVSMYNWLMAKAEQEAQKKSDAAQVATPTFTPPTEKTVAVAAVETPEMIEKRRQLSIKNTLAAIDDF